MMALGLALALHSAVVIVEEAPQPIEAAAWLEGRWVGEGMGGSVEEVWSPAHGGQMVGHFTYAREGAPVFYEIMLIRPDEAGNLEFLVKHFDADFTAWEEKDEWVTFAAIPDQEYGQRLAFRGLTLVLDEEGQFTATVTMRRSDGSVSDVPFVMTRAD
ncbi:DUF6265 family protein [Sphingomicrobium sediminis]|uniref:DUF6265 family protein n=1 Tax=Sphingomicrobium sediminis TaxID=2950949 RepID=A0A9X2ELG7_9SPHN|nr:DUF6265 family protein [Sphingomicrobium sediminis]MCM8557534.1 DUF6265 family protein [Sphingomicrobium sediminis]